MPADTTRDIVKAIASGDAKALKRAWRAHKPYVPQELAAKFVMQAWRRDVAVNASTAPLLAADGMLAAIYKAVFRAHDVGTSDNAGMLLFSTALEHDDDKLLALAWVWNAGGFMVSRAPFAGETAAPSGFVSAPREEVLTMIQRMDAPKCAAWYRAWAWGRAEGKNATVDSSSKKTVTAGRVMAPVELGGERLCMVHEHATYVRPATWEHDPRKTVLFVQFGLDGGGRVDATTPSDVRVAVAGRRHKACVAMERDGYELLETVNMNAAFYDGAEDLEAFKASAERAAAANSLTVVDATRRIDPGHGLVVIELYEPVTLV